MPPTAGYATFYYCIHSSKSIKTYQDMFFFSLALGTIYWKTCCSMPVVFHREHMVLVWIQTWRLLQNVIHRRICNTGCTLVLLVS